MKGLLVVLLAFGIMHAQAQNETQVQTFNVPEHGPGGTLDPYTSTLTFNQFDDSNGDELVSVEIIFSISTWDGWYSIENTGTTSAFVEVETRTSVSLTSTDVTLENESDQDIGDWERGSIEDEFSIPVGESSTLYGPEESDPLIVSSGGFVGEDYFAAFTGTGTFDIDYLSRQQFYVGGDAHISQSFQSGLATGQVTVIYTYTPIPEPGTLAMAAMGLAALVGRRYRRRKDG